MVILRISKLSLLYKCFSIGYRYVYNRVSIDYKKLQFKNIAFWMYDETAYPGYVIKHRRIAKGFYIIY
jgi:hypothetical protein